MTKKGESWVKNYIEPLRRGEMSLEDIRAAREKELGQQVKLSSVKKSLNKAGYSAVRPRHKICVGCKNWSVVSGACETPEQVGKGWTKGLAMGMCAYRR